ncbi:hypothetical protein LDENG_00002220 [Lucifuga dentata]|nr:hypothetical protein LDENG_00002220 [Lucifuga dentata]
MSSIDQMHNLRERNKDLLQQLKQQRERLHDLSSYSRKRERQADEEKEESEEEERIKSAEGLIRTEGDRGQARAALKRTTVRFADTNETQTGTDSTQPLASIHSGGTAQHTSDLLKHSNRLQDTRPSTKSRLVNQGKQQREMWSRVTRHSDEWDRTSASERHHLQPLLGYDWIAGVLDAESSLTEHSDEFFNDLCTFRSLNKEECVHSPQADFVENCSFLPLLTDKESPEANVDTHQCTFSYRINSRLFPVPLNSQECCPVCKKPKSSHPHTTAEPAFIRVNIPRSTLLPAYKYKAHRRRSFDPSDSLGLSSHCLSGWSDTGQSSVTEPSTLDLRSSLNMKNSPETLLAESWNTQQDLSAFKVSHSLHSGQIFNVSRLARHHFQHSQKKTSQHTFPCVSIKDETYFIE